MVPRWLGGLNRPRRVWSETARQLAAQWALSLCRHYCAPIADVPVSASRPASVVSSRGGAYVRTWLSTIHRRRHIDPRLDRWSEMIATTATAAKHVSAGMYQRPRRVAPELARGRSGRRWRARSWSRIDSLLAQHRQPDTGVPLFNDFPSMRRSISAIGNASTSDRPRRREGWIVRWG